ncbi:MAG: hypothetical protein R3B68_13340 [Phycisphaerales bacterium]
MSAGSQVDTWSESTGLVMLRGKSGNGWASISRDGTPWPPMRSMPRRTWRRWPSLGAAGPGRHPGYGVPNGIENNDDRFYYPSLYSLGCGPG